MKKIKDTLSYGSQGLFSFINSQHNPPWVDVLNGLILDELYYFKSGEKYTSSLLDEVSEDSRGATLWRYLANVVWAVYGDKWTRTYNALQLDYNPINNYDMVETENGTTSANSTNAVYGFNSTSVVPSDENAGQSTSGRTLTRSGNIGVTSSMQLLESEISLREYNFVKTMFRDADELLALKIY